MIARHLSNINEWLLDTFTLSIYDCLKRMWGHFREGLYYSFTVLSENMYGF